MHSLVCGRSIGWLGPNTEMHCTSSLLAFVHAMFAFVSPSNEDIIMYKRCTAVGQLHIDSIAGGEVANL